MKYIIYDATGQIKRIVHCSEDHVELQLKDSENYIADEWGDTSGLKHKIVNNERIEITLHDTPIPVSYLRAKEYRPVKDQLDDLWHAMDQGILPMVPAFYEPNAAVKNKYPKPESK